MRDEPSKQQACGDQRHFDFSGSYRTFEHHIKDPAFRPADAAIPCYRLNVPTPPSLNDLARFLTEAVENPVPDQLGPWVDRNVGDGTEDADSALAVPFRPAVRPRAESDGVVPDALSTSPRPVGLPRRAYSVGDGEREGPRIVRETDILDLITHHLELRESDFAWRGRHGARTVARTLPRP